MQRRFLVPSFVAMVALVAGATELSAQPLGTFRWRTEPYCNVITVTVTPIGGVYALDGFDEQCGGNPKQPVRGVALPQVNGSITIGVSVVLLPGGTPVNIEASISQTSLSGTWRERGELRPVHLQSDVHGRRATAWPGGAGLDPQRDRDAATGRLRGARRSEHVWRHPGHRRRTSADVARRQGGAARGRGRGLRVGRSQRRFVEHGARAQ